MDVVLIESVVFIVLQSFGKGNILGFGQRVFVTEFSVHVLVEFHKDFEDSRYLVDFLEV